MSRSGSPHIMPCMSLVYYSSYMKNQVGSAKRNEGANPGELFQLFSSAVCSALSLTLLGLSSPWEHWACNCGFWTNEIHNPKSPSATSITPKTYLLLTSLTTLHYNNVYKTLAVYLLLDNRCTIIIIYFHTQMYCLCGVRFMLRSIENVICPWFILFSMQKPF